MMKCTLHDCVDQHIHVCMKDQATPPGQCLLENKRINKEKILLVHWNAALNTCFTWAQCV